MPPAAAPRPYTPPLEMLMLVLCQLGETWWATLSSFAIRTPVAPMASASHLRALTENGDLMMWSSSSPIVLIAVPNDFPKELDWDSFAAEGASGRAAWFAGVSSVAVESDGFTSDCAIDHVGVNQAIAIIATRIDFRRCVGQDRNFVDTLIGSGTPVPCLRNSSGQTWLMFGFTSAAKVCQS